MKIVKSKKGLCAIVLPMIVGILMWICPPVFYLNDDVTMRSVLSGTYTGAPDGHAVYMQYPLTGLLALTYRVAGAVPWLEVFFAVCIVVCMVLVACRFKQPIIGCLAVLVLYVPFCLYMHYTLVAALVAATAVFLLAMGERGTWSVVLLLIAYMIRGQVGLLSLPFVACALVWRVIIAAKEEQKQVLCSKLKLGACLAGGLLICFLINNLSYSSPEWKHYMAYNEDRTLLYDYTDFLSTDKYAYEPENYGMSKEEYQVLFHYNTMLDAGIEETKMAEVAERVAAGMQQDISLLQELKTCLYEYYVQMRYHDMPYNYFWLGGYVFLAVGFVVYKKWMPLLLLGCLGIGRSSVWMYFLWQGRFPERVSQSLYLLELLLLLGMGLWLWERNGLSKLWLQRASLAMLAVMLAGVCGYQWKMTADKVEQQTTVQEEWDALKDYCASQPDRLYLADVFSIVGYAERLYEAGSANIMMMGGWMSASPLAQERLLAVGGQDAAEALVYGEKVSLLATQETDVQWLEKYLQKRFGTCELVVIGELKCDSGRTFVEYEAHMSKREDL